MNPKRAPSHSPAAAAGGRRAPVTGQTEVAVTSLCAIMESMAGKGRKHEPLPPEAIDLVAGRFRILGEPVRIRILQTLQLGEKNVTELVEAVGSTQPNVSKHLRILQDAGIVGRRQEGNNVYCYIADESVLDLCDAVCGSIRQQAAATAKLFGIRGR
jgi:DNA-binding transcriptional ArsR family regulator